MKSVFAVFVVTTMALAGFASADTHKKTEKREPTAETTKGGQVGDRVFSKSHFQTRVYCDLVGSNKFSIKVLKNSNMPAEVSIWNGTKGEMSVTIKGRDVQEMSDLSSAVHRDHLSVVAASGPNVIKLTSDYEMFGGDYSQPGESSWKGRAFVAPAIDGKNQFDVNCSYDI